MQDNIKLERKKENAGKAYAYIGMCYSDGGDNLEKDDDYLITDVRFKSEAKGIKDLEGIIVRVNREGAGAGNHISEIDLDDYSFDYKDF